MSYELASIIQDKFVRKALDSKKDPVIEKPAPRILTMEMNPVYTFGRRQMKDPESLKKFRELSDIVPIADKVLTMRGGQTTFHGPGQLVAYPIIDLMEFNLSSKCYVRLLENSIIELLSLYGLQGMLTENTGVWLSENLKIASIGVHLRRHITSHGIAVNGATDLAYFDHIVACGLPESKAVSIQIAAGSKWHEIMGDSEDPIRILGSQFAEIFSKRLGCSKVMHIGIDIDVNGL
ncbi:hypothetical protein V1511DRAFT_508370 [Dipodascopsis uninucleata]